VSSTLLDPACPLPGWSTRSPRPLLVDLCCGGGGAAVGYWRAGFDVVGVDLVRQWHYPFPMAVADAIAALAELVRSGEFAGRRVAAIHASPPCKRFTRLGTLDRQRLRLFEPHPDLLTPTLEMLQACPLPWVVENVPDSPMPSDAVQMCGSSFGLLVRRHRLFASNLRLQVPPCNHAAQPVVWGVYGNGGADAGRAARGGGGGVKVAGPDAAKALGVDWTTHQPSLSQMIPPAYSEHLGRQLLEAVTAA
jgi:DNA (cytosine-5)-methyltransferase 1